MNKYSKKLAYLLRHDNTYSFDRFGWRSVVDLILNHHYTRMELETIVLNDDKLRFEFSDDMNHIRACQGHSIEVDVELLETCPPLVLYHGTSTKSLASIQQRGIHRGKRLYVHLSETMNEAMQVGCRHGNPVVLQIDSQRMFEEGCIFYRSRNGVWLTDFIDVKFILQI